MENIKVKGFKGFIQQSMRSSGNKWVPAYYVSFGSDHWCTVGKIAVQLHLIDHKDKDIKWEPFLRKHGFKNYRSGRFPEFLSKKELLNFVDFLNGKYNSPFINIRFLL